MKNWAGNLTYRAAELHEPKTIEALQDLVRGAPKLRALGSRHSFSDVADTTGDLVSLVRMPPIFEIDPVAMTVHVDGGVRYGDLCERLDDAGFALHNMASLPHISVAGACATGTHGSGDRNATLSMAARALDLVRADGEIVSISRTGDAEMFPGTVVALGSLGIVTRITLDVQPTYLLRQHVFEDLAIDRFAKHFDEITAMAESTSFFTEWRSPVIDQVWLKRRHVDGDSGDPAELFGAIAATGERHPIRRVSPEACTPQLGVPGPWFERLPHFRMDHKPSSGEELQSEYLVDRRNAVPAFEALDRLRDRIAGLIQVCEIRTIAEDDLWLSPAYGRSSVAFHFTWKPDWPGVRALLPDIERALAPFDPRPHWGKLFTMGPHEVRACYPRMPDFAELALAYDPGAKFANEFVARFVLGGATGS